ncbi:MAG: TIGR00730 family Rossman fold protein [Alphaproteobacteria bacterium]|nr:TIGR00730 family Rossman fold protein [Alphaproteobacteria bacterium]
MALTICVFCGSASGNRPEYGTVAREMGRLIAESGARLVFGGGGLGLMGAVAAGAKAGGGQVTGIIPDFLRWAEPPVEALDELIVTQSMHERKSQMHLLSDAFVVLPGGLGTLEEMFEVLTLGILGQQQKPVILVNVEGYWDGLIALIDRGIEAGFIRAQARRLFAVVPDAPSAMAKLTLADTAEA